MENCLCRGSPRIAMDVMGEGTLLVLLHGIGGNRSNWQFQLPAFAGDFTVAAWTRAVTACPTIMTAIWILMISATIWRGCWTISAPPRPIYAACPWAAASPRISTRFTRTRWRRWCCAILSPGTIPATQDRAGHRPSRNSSSPAYSRFSTGRARPKLPKSAAAG